MNMAHERDIEKQEDNLDTRSTQDRAKEVELERKQLELEKQETENRIKQVQDDVLTVLQKEIENLEISLKKWQGMNASIKDGMVNMVANLKHLTDRRIELYRELSEMENKLKVFNEGSTGVVCKVNAENVYETLV